MKAIARTFPGSSSRPTCCPPMCWAPDLQPKDASFSAGPVLLAGSPRAQPGVQSGAAGGHAGAAGHHRGWGTFALPAPFLVLATQNPIEQEAYPARAQVTTLHAPR
ncbi:MAG: AAA family ATPase [Alphaproteobacteria bacterium]|nr:AAA family ATPase [Alphaproteobacteria bacterium]